MEDKGYVWKKQKIVHHANKQMNKTLIVHILMTMMLTSLIPI